MNKRAPWIPWKTGKCDFNVKRLARARIFHGCVSNDPARWPQATFTILLRYVWLCYVRSFMLPGTSITDPERLVPSREAIRKLPCISPIPFAFISG